tara:strand:- start:466467 stop:467105 length:639 start_codon:yes stop_codon:yes gene_type:complete
LLNWTSRIALFAYVIGGWLLPAMHHHHHASVHHSHVGAHGGGDSACCETSLIGSPIQSIPADAGLRFADDPQDCSSCCGHSHETFADWGHAKTSEPIAGSKSIAGSVATGNAATGNAATYGDSTESVSSKNVAYCDHDAKRPSRFVPGHPVVDCDGLCVLCSARSLCTDRVADRPAVCDDLVACRVFRLASIRHPRDQVLGSDPARGPPSIV